MPFKFVPNNSLGARIRSNRLFKECEAKVPRHRRGELSCLSNFIAKAGIIFPVRSTGWPIGGTTTHRFAIAEA